MSGEGKVACGAVSGALVGGVIGAGLGALSGVISGATGAAIMQAANHTGYDVQEAVKMGAIGGSILSGATGVLMGCVTGALSSNGLFARRSGAVGGGSTVAHVGNSVIAGMIGYGIMHSGLEETVMDLGRTAISFAVGSLATSIPVGVAVGCIALPIVVCCFYKEHENMKSHMADTFENMTNDMDRAFDRNFNSYGSMRI